MKRWLVIGVIFGFVLSFAIVQVEASDTSSLLDSASCTMCHGGGVARELGDYKGITAERVVTAIKDGVVADMPMPSAKEIVTTFGVDLSDDEVEQIATYIVKINK